jgi:uncharacterized protein YbjT (DUF2867 family)
MKIVLFGATGMVGQGVLREALLDPEVSGVLTIGRRATGKSHPKLAEITLPDLADYGAIEDRLAGYDACLYCLGVSSSGMSEADYTRVTYDYTVAAAEALLRHNAGLTFVFISGASTDSSEQGKVMWARVKGKAENAILRMPFRASYVFRPAFIRPVHGEVSQTKSYRVLYTLLSPLVPLIKLLFPRSVTTSERVARAMLRVARRGADKRVLENHEIDALGA